MSAIPIQPTENLDRTQAGTGRRFSLHHPDRMWVVESGTVDLFAVDRKGADSCGANHFLIRMEAGEAIFGIDPGADCPIGLTANCGPNTSVRAQDLSAFSRAMLEDESRETLLAGWVDKVSAAAAAAVTPKLFSELDPDCDLAVKETARAVWPKGGLLWVKHSKGHSHFLANPNLEPVNGCYRYPVTQHGWLEAQPDSRLHAVGTRSVLQEEPGLEGLHAFHANVVACLAGNLDAAERKERQRLLMKAEADAGSLETALLTLASPLGLSHREVLVTGDLLNTPLMLACSAVGKNVGIQMKPHPDMLQGITMRDPVAGIARASAVRYRRVALKGHWWKEQGGPLLVFREEENRPMAAIPRKRGSGYMLYDPVDRSTVPVTLASAQALNPFAYTFYKPLPAKSLTPGDMISFGLQSCKSELYVIFLMGIAAGLLGMVTPFATGIIFDSLIPGAQRPELVLACGFLVVAAVCAAMFTLARSFAVLRLEGKMESTMQAAVWDRLLSLPVPFFRDYSAGDMAVRSMGISEIRRTLTGTTLASILSGIFSIFSFAMLFYYSWRLALFATGLTIVACAASVLAGYLQIHYQRETLSLRGRISGMVLEFITGIAKFRVAGAESRAFVMWVKEFAQQKHSALSGRKVSNALMVFNSIFPVLSLGSIFAFNAYLMTLPDTVALSTGSFLAFTAAFTQFLTAALTLSSSLIAVLSIIPLYERAAPILKTLPEVDAARSNPGELSGAIEANHLVFRYRPDSPLILRDLSFTVQPGQFVAFVGPSGCGKSTLLRLLLGFETPESGAVYFDGQDLAGLDVQAVRRQMGVVLQTGKLISGDILTNIIGAAPLSVDDAWEAARLSGLDRDIRAMPMGLHTVINESGGGLSGGQRQRLMIARAIVAKPRILLFDEATSALDNHTQSIVSQSLKGLKATRIVIAHRLSTIIEADRIFVVDKGRIEQSGTYDELMKEGGLFAELAKRQLA